ncbi:VWA domain-containing protein, partial [Myxococcota bacterium]|nr:VWA domain-containing protein [Myxococcota bacterium]
HAAYRPQQDLAWGLMRLVPDERLIEAHPELRVSVHHVLILDLSGSMNEPDKYPRLLEAVAHYQAALDEADRLTLIPFSAYATTLTSGAVVGDLRDAGADMISTLESWPGRFQMTRLAPALDQAVRAIDATRAAGFEGAARLLCMTDGMIDDPFECRFGLAGIFQREARVDLLGFGHGFAIDQAEALLDRHPLSKIRYVEAGEGHISEYFAHLARTSQRIVLQGARLEVVIDEAVSCLEVFAARPNERFIGDLSDEAAARVEIPIGAMEARKAYLFLFHLRAWTSVEVAARLTLHATLRGAPFTLTSSLKIPLGEALGAPNGFVLDMAASLKHLAEPEGVDEIEATEARLRLYQLERRGARYVEALEHKLRVLKGEIVAPPAPPQDMRLYAEADAATCTGVFGVPSNGAPL